MPVTIRQATIGFKDKNGNYIRTNSLVEQTTNDQISSIQQAGASQVTAVQNEGLTAVGSVQSEAVTQITAIENKGAETLGSIPNDYTEINNKVDDLKSATKNAFVDTYNYFQIEWEQGNISQSGESTSANLIRSVDYYNASTGDKLVYNIASGYILRILEYKSDGTYVNRITNDVSGSGVTVVEHNNVSKIRFRLQNSGGTAILPSEGYTSTIVRLFGKSTLKDVVTPQMYGAVGDGNTDDTAAFQAAIMSGLCVYVPTSNNEKYKITNSLDIVNTCKRIYGDVLPNGTSTNGSIVFDLTGYDGDPTNVPLFKFTYAAQAISFGGLIIHSTKISGNAVGVCIDASKFQSGTTVVPDKDIKLTNMTISAFNKAIAMTGRGCSSVNCTFTECNNVGVYDWIGDYTDSNTAHPKEYNQRNITFNSCRFHSIKMESIVINSGHAYGLMASNCLMDTGEGTFIKAMDEAWNWNVTNNVIQGQTNTAIVLNNGMRNSNISNNVISRDAASWVNVSKTIPVNHAVIYGANNCVVATNVFNGSSGDAVILNGYKASLTWEQGNLNPSTGETSSSIMIRTNNYIEVPNGSSINVEYDDTSYAARAIVFSSASMDATTKQNYVFSSTDKTYENTSGSTRYVRFRLERSPTATDILPSVGNEAFCAINVASNGVAFVGNSFGNITGLPISLPYTYTNVSKIGNVDTQGREV